MLGQKRLSARKTKFCSETLPSPLLALRAPWENQTDVKFAWSLPIRPRLLPVLPLCPGRFRVVRLRAGMGLSPTQAIVADALALDCQHFLAIVVRTAT